MNTDNNTKLTRLDGNSEEQRISTEIFLSALTENEIKESMSDKFAYLDEE